MIPAWVRVIRGLLYIETDDQRTEWWKMSEKRQKKLQMVFCRLQQLHEIKHTSEIIQLSSRSETVRFNRELCCGCEVDQVNFFMKLLGLWIMIINHSMLREIHALRIAIRLPLEGSSGKTRITVTSQRHEHSLVSGYSESVLLSISIQRFSWQSR